MILFLSSYIFVAIIIFGLLSSYFLYGERTLSHSKWKKKELSNKLKCKMVEIRYKNRLTNEYFWHSISNFVWVNIFFIIMSLGVIYINNIFGVILGFFLLLIYIFFLKFAHKSYKNYPKIAEAKIKEFEKPLEDAINKIVEWEGDEISTYMIGDEIMAKDAKKIIILKQPKEVKKSNFPPFVDPKDRTVIEERKLEFIVFTNEYVASFLGASKFKLLKPDRKPLANGCEEKTQGVLGQPTQEHYYSNIEYGKFDGDTFKIWYKDGKEFELITVADKKAAELKKKKKTVQDALKYKLRITERQLMRKVDEYAKLEMYKKYKEEAKAKELDEIDDTNENSQE